MSDVSKTNEALIEEARSSFKATNASASMIRRLADALEAKTGIRVDMSSAVGVETQLAATREQGSAGDIRRAVRLWSERFIPGDRWDTEDARDLDAALKCVVEANPDRSRARVPVQAEPNDDQEALAKFPAIIPDRAFIRWRNGEIDRTGTLPEGFEMFRAGWNRAVAAVNGEHDHIEDGSSYLDCGACEMERKER